MKKILVVIMGVAAMVMSLSVPASASTSRPANSAVFFSPHQDDEVLTMGAAIHEHVQAGRATYVVLLTDGGASFVCARDFPSRAACVKARDTEFRNAVRAMGAIPVIPNNRMKDGQTTVAGLQAIMRPYMVKGHSLKTFSWVDDKHKDHLNAGKALRGLKFADSRYYIQKNYVAEARARGTKVFGHGTHKDSKCMAAVNAYKKVGWVSVPGMFADARKGLQSPWRMP